jgi:hypothetical protein
MTTTLTKLEIETLGILCRRNRWNYVNIEKKNDREFDIHISGESFSARMPLSVISNTNWADDSIWDLTDAYGKKGLVPPQGHDWSGIRDSSEEQIWEMFRVAIKVLEEDELKKNIETILELERHENRV